MPSPAALCHGRACNFFSCVFTSLQMLRTFRFCLDEQLPCALVPAHPSPFSPRPPAIVYDFQTFPLPPFSVPNFQFERYFFLLHHLFKSPSTADGREPFLGRRRVSTSVHAAQPGEGRRRRQLAGLVRLQLSRAGTGQACLCDVWVAGRAAGCSTCLRSWRQLAVSRQLAVPCLNVSSSSPHYSCGRLPLFIACYCS